MRCVVAALAVALSLAALVAAPSPARAGSHALLVAIADYPRPRTLPAVLQDMSHAREMARRLGVPAERIQPVFNGEVTQQRLLAELDALAGRVSRDDQVFIYFSGHGARRGDPERIEQCREYLVTLGSGRDQLLDERLFKDKVQKIAERSAQVLVMLDACHSGGLTLNRSLGGADEAVTVKALPPADACKVIRNRSLSGELRGARNNITVLAAAQADEVAWTTKSVNGGSYATLGWLGCLRDGRAADSDGSGAISARELTACAQQRVDALARDERQKSQHRQHLVLEGENAQVLALLAPQPQIRPQSPAPPAPVPATAVKPPPAPVTAPATVSAPPPAPASPASPAAALHELHASRDPNWAVSLTSDKARYRIKQEPIVLRVSSERDGYLYLLQHTEENRDVCLLFPNTLDQKNRLTAGVVGLTLGNGPGWFIVPEGMRGGGGGRDTFTAVVTSRPLNLAGLALLREGELQCSAASAQPEQLAALARIFLDDGAGRGNFGAARQEVEEYP